jgi:hypothetical protein
MGYKIPDLKEDIHWDIMTYLDGYDAPFDFTDETKKMMQGHIEDIIDKHFAKIER